MSTKDLGKNREQKNRKLIKNKKKENVKLGGSKYGLLRNIRRSKKNQKTTMNLNRSADILKKQPKNSIK